MKCFILILNHVYSKCNPNCWENQQPNTAKIVLFFMDQQKGSVFFLMKSGNLEAD